MSKRRQAEPMQLRGPNGQVMGASDRVFWAFGPSKTEGVVADTANLAAATQMDEKSSTSLSDFNPGLSTTKRALGRLENGYLKALFPPSSDDSCTALANPWLFDAADDEDYWNQVIFNNFHQIGLALGIRYTNAEIKKLDPTSLTAPRITLKDKQIAYIKVVSDECTDRGSIMLALAEFNAAERRKAVGHSPKKNGLADHEALFCVANAPPPVDLARNVRPMGLGMLKSGHDKRPLLHVDIRIADDIATARGCVAAIPGVLYLAVFEEFEYIDTGYSSARGLVNSLEKKLRVVPLMVPFGQDPQYAGARFLHAYRTGEWTILRDKVARKHIGDAFGIGASNDRLFCSSDIKTQLTQQFDYDRILPDANRPIERITSGMAMIRAADVRLAGAGDIPHPPHAYPALSDDTWPLRTNLRACYKMRAMPTCEVVSVSLQDLIAKGIESRVAQAAGIMRHIGYIGRALTGGGLGSYEFKTIQPELLEKAKAVPGLVSPMGKILKLPHRDYIQTLVSAVAPEDILSELTVVVNSGLTAAQKLRLVLDRPSLDILAITREIEHDRKSLGDVAAEMMHNTGVEDAFSSLGSAENDWIVSRISGCFDYLFRFFRTSGTTIASANYSSAEELEVFSAHAAAFCVQFVATRVACGMSFAEARASLFSGHAVALRDLDALIDSTPLAQRAAVLKDAAGRHTPSSRRSVKDKATHPVLYAHKYQELLDGNHIKDSETFRHPTKNDAFKRNASRAIQGMKRAVSCFEQYYRVSIEPFGFPSEGGMKTTREF